MVASGRLLATLCLGGLAAFGCGQSADSPSASRERPELPTAAVPGGSSDEPADTAADAAPPNPVTQLTGSEGVDGADDAAAQRSPGPARDAALWPFASNSPWNTSLGSGAKYTDIDSPGFSPDGGANLNVKEWSYPVSIAKPTDPKRNFYWRDGNELIGTMRVPNDAQPDSQGDGSLIVINDAHNAAIEMWQASRRPNGDWEGSVTVEHDLRGTGFYSDYRGTRAGGMAATGGLIRRDELINRDIPHALAVAVRPKAMNRNGPNRAAYVWPASWADGGDGGGYGTAGNLYMGSLLAIPPDVDLEKLNLSPQGLAVARALQDYGAYVVDQGSGNIIYYAEPKSADILETSAEELGRLSKFLKVVPNNAKFGIAGGGKRRRPAAPSVRVLPR